MFESSGMGAVVRWIGEAVVGAPRSVAVGRHEHGGFDGAVFVDVSDRLKLVQLFEDAHAEFIGTR